MSYLEYVESAQQFFYNLVEHASDDELFAGGYLRGHFDLAVGYAQVDEQALTIEELNANIEKSLVKAYHNGELNDDDKRHVVVIWEQIKALVA
jgi:hypothetical protein